MVFNQCLCCPPYAHHVDHWGLSSDWDYKKVIEMDGCEVGCASRIHHLLLHDLIRLHDHFTSLSQLARKQWLLDFIANNTTGSGNEATTTFIISGKSVCFKVWLATLHISHTHFYNVKAMFNEGATRVIHHVNRVPMQKTFDALVWMDDYFMKIGDRMPDKPVVHLPSSLTKTSVYERMKRDMADLGKKSLVSQSQFFKLWDTHYKHVSIPKVWFIFTLQPHILHFHVQFHCRRIDSPSVMYAQHSNVNSACQ